MGWDGPLTHRQFLCWNIWLDEQLEVPSRDTYYLMQIAYEIRRQSAKNPNKYKIDNFKLKWTKTEKNSRLLSEIPKEEVERTKALFIGLMNAPITRYKNGEIVEVIEPPKIAREKLLQERINKQKEARQQQIENMNKKKEEANGRRINRQNDRRRK